MNSSDTDAMRAAVFRHFLTARPLEPATVVTLWVEDRKPAPKTVLQQLDGFRFGRVREHGPWTGVSIESVEWRGADKAVVQATVVCRSSCSHGHQVYMEKVNGRWVVESDRMTWVD